MKLIMFARSMPGACLAFVTFTDWTEPRASVWAGPGASGEPGNAVPPSGRRRSRDLTRSWAAAAVLQDCRHRRHRRLGGVAEDFDVGVIRQSDLGMSPTVPTSLSFPLQNEPETVEGGCHRTLLRLRDAFSASCPELRPDVPRPARGWSRLPSLPSSGGLMKNTASLREARHVLLVTCCPHSSQDCPPLLRTKSGSGGPGIRLGFILSRVR